MMFLYSFMADPSGFFFPYAHPYTLREPGAVIKITIFPFAAKPLEEADTTAKKQGAVMACGCLLPSVW